MCHPVCVWPFGLLDYGSALLRCKICHLATLQAGCRGRATICKDTLMVLKETPHSCGTDQLDIEILHLENKMKNMAEETTLGLRRIFDEVSSDNPQAAAKISFTRMESAMSKRRHKSRCVN